MTVMGRQNNSTVSDKAKSLNAFNRNPPLLQNTCICFLQYHNKLQPVHLLQSGHMAATLALRILFFANSVSLLFVNQEKMLRYMANSRSSASARR